MADLVMIETKATVHFSMTPTKEQTVRINILPRSCGVRLDSLRIGQPFRFPNGDRVYIVSGRDPRNDCATNYVMIGSESGDWYADRGNKEVVPLEFESITLREV